MLKYLETMKMLCFPSILRRTVTSFGEDFCDKNHNFVLYDERKKVCRFHKLLFRFKEIMENDLSFRQKKIPGNYWLKIFSQKYTWWCNCFFFLNLVQKILVTNVANIKYLKIQKQKILFNYLQQNVGWLVVPRKRQLF